MATEVVETVSIWEMSVKIDAMQIEDIPAVRALLESTPELGVSQSFDTPDRLRAYLARNPGFSTVARAERRIVGVVLCGQDGRRGSFYHAAVLPEFRRQGIAEQMIERSLGCLRDAGLSTAFVFTHVQNGDAQSFWQSTGWEHCDWVQYHCREF